MAPVAVEIMTAPGSVAGDEITLVDDVDTVSSAAVMLGCGDDNPYN